MRVRNSEYQMAVLPEYNLVQQIEDVKILRLGSTGRRASPPNTVQHIEDIINPQPKTETRVSELANVDMPITTFEAPIRALQCKNAAQERHEQTLDLVSTAITVVVPIISFFLGLYSSRYTVAASLEASQLWLFNAMIITAVDSAHARFEASMTALLRYTHFMTFCNLLLMVMILYIKISAALEDKAVVVRRHVEAGEHIRAVGRWCGMKLGGSAWVLHKLIRGLFDGQEDYIIVEENGGSESEDGEDDVAMPDLEQKVDPRTSGFESHAAGSDAGVIYASSDPDFGMWDGVTCPASFPDDSVQEGIIVKPTSTEQAQQATECTHGQEREQYVAMGNPEDEVTEALSRAYGARSDDQSWILHYDNGVEEEMEWDIIQSHGNDGPSDMLG